MSEQGYFCPGQLLRSEAAVPLIVFGVSGIVEVELGRGDIEAPPPDLDLILAVFLYGFEFVESLQRAVVAFVESPVLDDGDVMAVELLCGVVEGLDGPGEDGGVADVELVAVLLQRLAGLDGFLDACVAREVPPEESLTSVHPVNRFSLFQRLSPCRRNTTLYF